MKKTKPKKQKKEYDMEMTINTICDTQQKFDKLREFAYGMRELQNKL
jgi:acetyl-CoA carboxylase carboxyltransferase component